MPSRVFVDSRSRRWTVWEVHPTSAERRARRDDPRPEPRHERRHRDLPRATIRTDYVAGWLVFETRGEKRRIAPVPPAWDELADEALEELLDEAEPVYPSRRLIE